MTYVPETEAEKKTRFLLFFLFLFLFLFGSQVLPEEAVSHRIVVAEATREEFLQQLCASSAFLLSSLEQIAAGPLGAEIMVQVPVRVLVLVL